MSEKKLHVTIVINKPAAFEDCNQTSLRGPGVLLLHSLASVSLLSLLTHAIIRYFTAQSASNSKMNSKEAPVAVSSAADSDYLSEFACNIHILP